GARSAADRAGGRAAPGGLGLLGRQVDRPKPSPDQSLPGGLRCEVQRVELDMGAGAQRRRRAAEEARAGLVRPWRDSPLRLAPRQMKRAAVTIERSVIW